MGFIVERYVVFQHVSGEGTVEGGVQMPPEAASAINECEYTMFELNFT